MTVVLHVYNTQRCIEIGKGFRIYRTSQDVVELDEGFRVEQLVFNMMTMV